ncbi:MAG: hypothetical protein ACRD8K_02655 [Nitrososphaeraceae archaeon]|jgi:hypothetical protein
MPMLMLKCKTCGEVFPGIYIVEESTNDYEFKSSITKNNMIHSCSRGHQNEYSIEDYMDWSKIEII